MNDMNGDVDAVGEIERRFRAAAADPERLGAPTGIGAALEQRLGENLSIVHAELDAPRDPRLARVLRRIGVPDLTVPLVTATPALRRSWFAAVAVAVLFALSVASNDASAGVDRIGAFLTLAPLVPLLGVALAFGPGVDPTHDLVVAAPRDTFRVFLVRSVTVLVASSVVLVFSSVLLPTGGVYRVAWLLPALALTGTTMALAVGRDPRRVAAAVGAGWVGLAIVVMTGGSAAAMFGPVTQLLSAIAATMACLALFRRRGMVETVGVDS